MIRQIYAIPLLIFALGLGLVIYSTSGGSSIAIFGFNVVIQVVRGVGLIAIIFSAIAFLGAYGNTILSKQHEPDLRFAGLVLRPRTATAVSVLFMVFGALMTLKSIAERKFQ